MPEVALNLLDPRARIPQRQSSGAAGHDLHALEECELTPGTSTAVRTGIAIALPVGYEAQIRPRSGLALHHNILIPNSPGTIDSDYRGEICVIMHNLGPETFRIQSGDRIAQLVIAPVCAAAWKRTEQLPETGRDQSGFGSTGLR